jgi:hypothetical protein
MNQPRIRASHRQLADLNHLVIASRASGDAIQMAVTMSFAIRSEGLHPWIASRLCCSQ